MPNLGFARRRESSAPRIACDDTIAAAIALISDEDIAGMKRNDLIDAVQAAQTAPRSPVRSEKIADLDERALRRVMHLVRRWMRIRINQQTAEKGWTPYFCSP